MAPQSAASHVSVASSGSMLGMLSPQPPSSQSFAGAQPSQLPRASPQPFLSATGPLPQVTQSVPCTVLLQTYPSIHRSQILERGDPSQIAQLFSDIKALRAVTG